MRVAFQRYGVEWADFEDFADGVEEGELLGQRHAQGMKLQDNVMMDDIEVALALFGDGFQLKKSENNASRPGVSAKRELAARSSRNPSGVTCTVRFHAFAS